MQYEPQSLKYLLYNPLEEKFSEPFFYISPKSYVFSIKQSHCFCKYVLTIKVRVE